MLQRFKILEPKPRTTRRIHNNQSHQLRYPGQGTIRALLENIIEDSIHQATSLPEAREMGKKGIDKLINLIKTKENNYPDSTVAIVCPIGRPGTEWYDHNIKGWTDDLIIATAEAFLEKDYTVTKQPAFNYNL